MQDRLALSNAGGAVLFCGAGFSADCLNFEFDQQLGVSGALTHALSERLAAKTGKSYRKLTTAAQAYEKEFQTAGLREFIRDRYHVASPTADMIDILRYPWDRIYTTNYDNAIELALTRAHKSHRQFNNRDAPPLTAPHGVPVVYLHGRAESWTDDDIYKRSCLLTAESYNNPLEKLGPWAQRLQDDYDRAQLFVFIGFSAADLHLNQIFFNASAARDKVFFINRKTSQIDNDADEEQGIYGTPVYCGSSDFAARTEVARALPETTEPHSPSFLRYDRPEAATTIPGSEAIENLLIMGDPDPAQIARDLGLATAPEYHISRSATGDILARIAVGHRLFLIAGEICDGKTLLIEELALQLSSARRVYRHRQTYDSILDDIREFMVAHPGAVMIIENCFELRGRLDDVVKQVASGDGLLILTSRSLSARAEVEESGRLRKHPDMQEIRLGKLDDTETATLSRLADQIGGWAGFPATPAGRIRYIQEDCRGSLPSFMLHLLDSDVARNRYAVEYNRVMSELNPAERKAITGALCLTHIGHDPTTALISNLFQVDFSALLRRLNGPGSSFRLVREDRGFIRTVPTIGARAILRSVVPNSDPHQVVDAVVMILRRLSAISRNAQEEYIFKQLMRYSVINKLLADGNHDEHRRFFDNVSQIDACRKLALFWLQRHICMVDHKNWSKAEDYLENSYTRADEFDARRAKGKPTYDRSHIDDRKAKFLMQRGLSEPFRPTMMRDLKDSCELTGRLLRRQDMTHHPYHTISLIVGFYRQHGPQFAPNLRTEALKLVLGLGDLAAKRRGNLPPSSPNKEVDEALEAISLLRAQNPV